MKTAERTPPGVISRANCSVTSAREENPDKEKPKRKELESQIQAKHGRLDEIAEDGEDEDKDQALFLNYMIAKGLVVADARLAYRHDLSKFFEMSLYGLRSANQLQKREQQKRRLQDIKVWIHLDSCDIAVRHVYLLISPSSQEFLRSLT
ncbi:hypothetical protein FGLOB1_21 [Fusarium globosum]|uniref:Uncharacterized protein n=1 Tax=Fusarium globosum TaxID=78864 RepID=A0A8H5YZZ8_9HYPO|nr:hypothetical protein FGLOB1_21 [Fusarium globosum]